MQPHRLALLIAAGLVIHSPLLSAAEIAPVESVAQTAAANDDAAPTGPLAASSSPFERNLGADDIPSVQLPTANNAPASPPLMDLTKVPTSLWQRIRNGFGLPDIVTPLVREQEEWFANRPDYLKRTVERSNRYLYHIVEEVEKRGMPSEIALLPIIESAFNPTAYSRAHASGIWQFIPETGKRYGLQQNFWYDGRRDVMAATTAALDYLEKLYDQFGSWDLALAAYNWGENAVARAIAKNLANGLPADYLSLSMPLETRYYIPKLQAVKNLIAKPAQYGVELAEVPNRPYFVAVATTRHIDVKLAAKLADVPLGEFVSLNPGHNRPVIKADGSRTMLLPADKAATFHSNLENHGQPLVSWQAYQLKSGESIDRVATRHHISVAELKRVNGITGKRRLAAGSTLLVPGSVSATPHLPDLPSSPVTVAKAPSKKTAHKATRKGGVVKVAQTRKGQASKATQARKTAKKGATTTAKKTTTGGPKKLVLAQQPR